MNVVVDLDALWFRERDDAVRLAERGQEELDALFRSNMHPLVHLFFVLLIF